MSADRDRFTDVLVFFAPSVAMQGGPAPAELARRYPPIAAAADADVDAVLAAVAGFFTGFR